MAEVAIHGSGFQGPGGEEAINEWAEGGGAVVEDIFRIAEEGFDGPDTALVEGEFGGVFVAEGERRGVKVKIGMQK